jgi:hypothetical protein
MSLKGFHILFITLAFLCAGGFWAWSVWDVAAAQQQGAITTGHLSGFLAIVLLVYGLWFVIKKSKTINV